MSKRCERRSTLQNWDRWQGSQWEATNFNPFQGRHCAGHPRFRLLWLGKDWNYRCQGSIWAILGCQFCSRFSCYEILKPSGIERIPQLIKTCDPVQLRRVQGPTTQAPKGGHLSCHQKSSKINPNLAVFLQVPGWAPKVKPFPQAYRL